MSKIKLLILLLINISLVSCTNNTGNNNFKLSIAYIGGEYDGLVLSNQLKSHLNNFGMFDRSSKYEIQANISHSQNLYISFYELKLYQSFFSQDSAKRDTQTGH